jgi:hypothetical protein
MKTMKMFKRQPDMCSGCEYREIKYLVPTCVVYPAVPGVFLRAGRCPFNPPVVESVKKKIRVGQQKQRKLI